MSLSVMSGNPPAFGVPRRLYGGPLEYPSAHSIDFDAKNDRLLVAPSFAVQGDLTVLVNWQSRLPQDGFVSQPYPFYSGHRAPAGCAGAVRPTARHTSIQPRRSSSPCASGRPRRMLRAVCDLSVTGAGMRMN